MPKTTHDLGLKTSIQTFDVFVRCTLMGNQPWSQFQNEIWERSIGLNYITAHILDLNYVTEYMLDRILLTTHIKDLFYVSAYNFPLITSLHTYVP